DGRQVDLPVVAGLNPEKGVGDRLDPLTTHGDLVSHDLSAGDLELRTVLDHPLQSLLETQSRDVLLDVAGDTREWELRRSHHGQQALPILPQSVLGSSQGDPLALSCDLRREDVWPVGLPDIGHFASRPKQLLMVYQQLSLDLDELLSR